MPTWHPEPVSGYTPVPVSVYSTRGGTQRKPSGSAARFPPSAAAERSEPSELHDRWTFSASMTALLELLKNADPEVKAQLRLVSADLNAKFTTHFKVIPAHAEDSYENSNRAKTVH